MDGFFTAQSTWRGDLCGVAAAVLWAATTVLIRATRLAQASAAKPLLYQLAVSAVVLPIFSFLLGEHGMTALTPTARYYAGRLSVLSFLTPMFGVACGVVFLGEPLSGRFGLAAIAVGAGIALVNVRR